MYCMYISVSSLAHTDTRRWMTARCNKRWSTAFREGKESVCPCWRGGRKLYTRLMRTLLGLAPWTHTGKHECSASRDERGRRTRAVTKRDKSGWTEEVSGRRRMLQRGGKRQCWGESGFFCLLLHTATPPRLLFSAPAGTVIVPPWRVCHIFFCPFFLTNNLCCAVDAHTLQLLLQCLPSPDGLLDSKESSVLVMFENSQWVWVPTRDPSTTRRNLIFLSCLP